MTLKGLKDFSGKVFDTTILQSLNAQLQNKIYTSIISTFQMKNWGLAVTLSELFFTCIMTKEAILVVTKYHHFNCLFTELHFISNS